MSTQCLICGNCVENCQRCPQGCEYLTIFNLNKKRINRRVRLKASLQLFQKKGAVVSRMVGQGATPSHLLQAGGPGDLISAVQQCAPRATRAARRSVRYNKGFSLGTSKNRLSCKGSVGVDKKHGSYARYLARKTGGVLRKEQMPRVKQRKASIHSAHATALEQPCRAAAHLIRLPLSVLKLQRWVLLLQRVNPTMEIKKLLLQQPAPIPSLRWVTILAVRRSYSF